VWSILLSPETHGRIIQTVRMKLLKKRTIKKYEGCFELIAFSIIEDSNSGKEHNPEGNVKPFSKVFKCDVINSFI
jgi:hypothetical protein